MSGSRTRPVLHLCCVPLKFFPTNVNGFPQWRILIIAPASKQSMEMIIRCFIAPYKGFEEANGVPILCNTSLNDQGEPIVNTAEEALNFALRKRIEIMYVNGKRVQLQNHQAYPSDRPLTRRTLVEELPAHERQQISAQYNPYGIDDESLGLYYMVPEVYVSYDLRDKDSSRFCICLPQGLKNGKVIDIKILLIVLYSDGMWMGLEEIGISSICSFLQAIR